MKAHLLPPRENYNGNLIWRKEDFIDKVDKISTSLEQLRSLGYWASPFPEGDGITFSYKNDNHQKNNLDIIEDFRKCFEWVDIELAKSVSSNVELAELEDERKMMKCTVIVPIEKIFIQETISIGKYTLYCEKQFDENPDERLSKQEGSYIQFDCQLPYIDLLRLNTNIDHNSHVINKCLSIAEYALDLVRFSHSSFTRKEFTPNPAGQRASGFYDVEIIPLEKTHLGPLILSGISRPLSVSNNWLGPQVDSISYPGIQYLSSVYDKVIENELSTVVTFAMRSCRQSFYSIGDESQFLNLIFSLDGLSNIDSGWKGWKQRTYIAALTCNNSSINFKENLEVYDNLYTNVRNKLVHDGKDFYQLQVDSNESSEQVFTYIKKIIALIERNNFSTLNELRGHAVNLLNQEEYKMAFREVIDRISILRGIAPKYPLW
ncbi:hypothetical protein I5R28_18990 [Serratia marcescens]|uniref:hypothetical protein n=1 Tax=Serratia TaxID=613 RepID=UPI0018D8B198|nr:MULTISPECIES: hypothetical protein [Serratia]MBH3171999.1 hypothetical protein [Serratia marcescens]UMK55999.1 hypothetical protein L2D50_16145 [Serratia marcescens]HBK4689134.1 hypothetical protein [Serratia marcescens]